MKYAVEMGSGVMMYIPSIINKCSLIQNLIGGIHRQHCDGINVLLFFQNKESRVDVGFEFWPGYQLFSLHPQFHLGCGF
jgi:hypothetical protein